MLDVTDVLDGLLATEQPVAAVVKPSKPALPRQPRPRRPTPGTQVADAIDALCREDDGLSAGKPGTSTEGRSTAGDLAAARQIFDELAVGHVAQVRDVMLELQVGEVACSWVESSKPALRSLRAMAEQMELTELCGALDEFCVGVDLAVAGGQGRVGDHKDELMRRYQRLIELIPRAFELDAERDRREPLIVESLLRQVDGVETFTIDKLRAVGLDRLVTLLHADADEMAVASGIRREIAVAIVERLRAYRSASPAAVAAPDRAVEHQALRALVATLEQQHEQFERAASGWSDDARAAKKAQRKDRDQSYLQIKVVLARLGERDRIARLDKAAYHERIADLEQFLAETRIRPPAPTEASVQNPVHGG